ncbi:MAG: hypothetical protein HUU08_01425 [Candidatus Brocadia sp.]|nr:hypothetical protein [Candidatus Brocadia sp.]
MLARWKDNVTVGVGVDAIGGQHKGIFTRIKNLLSAISQGRGKEEITEKNKSIL